MIVYAKVILQETIATNISVSVPDGQYHDQTIDALWSHQSQHQHSLVTKLWNTFFTQWSQHLMLYNYQVAKQVMIILSMKFLAYE